MGSVRGDRGAPLVPGGSERPQPWWRRLLARFRRRPSPPVVVPEAPPQRYRCGGLEVVVTRLASAPLLGRPVRLVYRVEVATSDGRSWIGRIGFPLDHGSERRAAEAALLDLERLWRDPRGWEAEWTAGLNEREADALLGAASVAADRLAAAWIGPAVAAARAASWSWLEEVSPPDRGAGSAPG